MKIEILIDLKMENMKKKIKIIKFALKKKVFKICQNWR